MKALKQWLMRALGFFMMAVFLLMVGLTLATEDSNTPHHRADKVEQRETVIVRIQDGEAIYGHQDEQFRKKEDNQTVGREKQLTHEHPSDDTTHEATIHPDPAMKSYGLLDDIGRQAGDVLSSLTRKSINHLFGGSR